MPIVRPSSPVTVEAVPFADASAAVITQVRAALSELVAALPGPVTRAVDIERQLQVDRKLAWRIFRVVQSSGLSEAANIPARPVIRRLLAAAEVQGIPEAVVRRVSEASECFERFASRHGGSREDLIALVARMSGEESERFDIKMRKAFFRAGAHLWGVQAQLQVRTMIHAAPPDGYRGGVLVAGDIGLQRRDPSRALVVSARLRAHFDEDGEAVRPDGPAAAGGPELMPEYCTQPLPAMAPQPSVEGRMETEMIFPVSGRAGGITLYTCCSVPGAEDVPSGVDSEMFITIPTEALVLDVMLSAGWSDPSTARAAVYGRRHHPEHVEEKRSADLFPQHETVSYLGALENIPPVAGAPYHQAAVRDVVGRYGWGGMRFDVYRCRIEYPVLHTLIALRIDPCGRGGRRD
jgi:hypothetical protein